MSKSKQQKARELVKLAGRQSWEINPQQRVIPNKKKAKPLRKEKHKGRQSADLWRLWSPLMPQLA